MGKWALGWVVVLLACVPIFLSRASDPSLLWDSDTKVLLEAIRARQNPWSWFGGDWPLENHFYRPVSTLSFELDNAVYGSNAAGYGLTNVLLAIACVLLLFWFLRELTDRIEVALPGALLFALWHGSFALYLPQLAWWLGWLCLGAALLPGRRVAPTVISWLTLVFLSNELVGLFPLHGRMIAWLPGRTASVMTMFVLAGLAAYARYERVSAARISVEPGPLDPPATKGTVVAVRRGSALGWAVLAIFCLACALGSYEQAVMMPALLLGVAVCLRLQRIRVRWGWQAGFWALLAGYLVLRSRLVPGDVSGYQAQQFRAGPGVIDSLMQYLLPAWAPAWGLANSIDVGPYLWLNFSPYVSLVRVLSNVGAVVAARKDWILPLSGWALSFLAFLPMAWLKHFDHYHYLPMAMRALFVAALLTVAGKALVSAVSHRALAAPPRPDPAPGSLPHR